MTDLEAERQRHAEAIRQTAKLQSPALIRAFAQVPRERYLGPGPWQIWEHMRYHTTPNADPRHLYRDVPVAFDPARWLNNGQPSFVAFLLEALELHEKEQVVHVDCGTGYYTAILAEMIGPAGRVIAIEIDAELAARARDNLAPLPQVTVVHADGGEYDPGGADAIFINAGASHPHALWLDRLLPGERLVLPLTTVLWRGHVLKVQRHALDYAARFIAEVGIFPCSGARDLDADRRLGEALLRGGIEAVRSLRRDAHEPDSTCWLHSADYCLSTGEIESNCAP